MRRSAVLEIEDRRCDPISPISPWPTQHAFPEFLEFVLFLDAWRAVAGSLERSVLRRSWHGEPDAFARLYAAAEAAGVLERSELLVPPLASWNDHEHVRMIRARVARWADEHDLPEPLRGDRLRLRVRESVPPRHEDWLALHEYDPSHAEAAERVAMRMIETGAFEEAERVLQGRPDAERIRLSALVGAAGTGQFLPGMQFYADRIPGCLKLLVDTCNSNVPGLHRAERESVLAWWAQTNRDRTLLAEVLDYLEPYDPDLVRHMRRTPAK